MANAAIISEFNTRGKDISIAGTGFEYLVQTFMLDYAASRDKGKSHDSALTKMTRMIVTPSQFPNSHPVYRCAGLFGNDEYALIHDDGKISAGRIIEYVHDSYEYLVVDVHHTGKQNQGNNGHLVSELTGKKSNADLVIKAKPTFKDIYEYIGASLKYSKSVKKTGNTIKIYAPTIMNFAKQIDSIYERCLGKPSSLLPNITRLRDKSIESQKKVVAKHHKLMLSTFGELETRLYYDNSSTKDRPCRYTPVYQGKRCVGGVLSHGAVSYIRDCSDPKLRAVFDEMAEHNLLMKREVCHEFYKAISDIVSTGSRKHRCALYRCLLNLADDRLPTINVSASRKKSGTFVSIFDLQHAADLYFKKHTFDLKYTRGSSRMNLGPCEFCIDSRTGFAGDPLTGPVNISIKKNQLLGD